MSRGSPGKASIGHKANHSEKDRWNDRHNIPKPSGKKDASKGATRLGWAGWRNGLKERIAELFISVENLGSHVQEVQTKFVSLSKAVEKKEIEADEAKSLFKEMCDCIKKAADNTTPRDLDKVGGVWGPCAFSCDGINATYTIERNASGKIITARTG